MKQTLEQAKKKYAGEWIAFVVKEEKNEIEKLTCNLQTCN